MHRFAFIPLAAFTALAAAQEPLLAGRTLDGWEYDPAICLSALTGESTGQPTAVMDGGIGIFTICSGPWKLVKSDVEVRRHPSGEAKEKSSAK